MNNQKTNWKYLLIVIIIGLIVGGGILWLVKKETKFFEIKLPEKIQKNGTIKWNIYTTDSFFLKYPHDWKVTVSEDKQYFETQITFHKNNDALFTVKIGNYDNFLRKVSNIEEMIKGTKEWVERYGSGLEEETTSLDNNLATKISFRISKYDISSFDIYLERGGEIYTLSAQTDSSQKETYFPIFNQILSSFRFIKQN